MIQSDIFYQELTRIATQPAYSRYGLLAEFHTKVTLQYLNALRMITEQKALQPGSDGRSIAQVVGHIAEWDRFTLLAVGEIAVGVQCPRIMSLAGYTEPDGTILGFADKDAFNAYQIAKHANWTWEQIQELAIHMATALHAFFTQPALISPDLLEQTHTCKWGLPTGISLSLPAGWYLWLVSLEHKAVLHAADIYFE